MKMNRISLSAIMLCLQKSLLEQSDILPMLEDLDFEATNGELTVLNPPQIDLSKTADETLADAFNELSVEEIEQ